MSLASGLSHIFNRQTAAPAAFTALNLVFAAMALPSLWAAAPAACALWSAHQWKQSVTGRGLW